MAKLRAQNDALQPASERAALTAAERAHGKAEKRAAEADGRAAAQQHTAQLAEAVRLREAQVVTMRAERRAETRAAEATAAQHRAAEEARPRLQDETVARALQQAELRAARERAGHETRAVPAVAESKRAQSSEAYLLLLVAAPAAVTMMKTTARQRAGACAQRNPSRLGYCKSCAGWQSKPGSSSWLWMRWSWYTLLLVHHVLATVLLTQISTRGSGSFSSSSQRSSAQTARQRHSTSTVHLFPTASLHKPKWTCACCESRGGGGGCGRMPGVQRCRWKARRLRTLLVCLLHLMQAS